MLKLTCTSTQMYSLFNSHTDAYLFYVRKDFEKELEIMKANDLMEEVDGLTPWVSPIVVAPKPKSQNEVRICDKAYNTHHTYSG